jgi:glycerol-3-phosphate dehydrogenase (NAD(P)+)
VTEAKVCVIGTGSWGTTLAVLIARQGRPVTMWARTSEEAATIQVQGANERFLPGVSLPPSLTVTHELREAVAQAALVLMVVPAQTMRANTRALAGFLPPEAVVLSCAKGLEQGSLQRMTEVMAQELPTMQQSLGVLSGPNLAREIADGLFASTVVAMADQARAQMAQRLIGTPTFRVYTHQDVIGIELCGALKNIIAIGAGAADELGVGENAKAMYITRGLAEVTRLGTAAGAHPLTFAGLAGLGDLLCTCASRHSRNHYVGVELAKGRTWAEIRAGMRQVAEGVYTVPAALDMARRSGVEMPITNAIHDVLFGEKPIRRAITELMGRLPKHELDGFPQTTPRPRGGDFDKMAEDL